MKRTFKWLSLVLLGLVLLAGALAAQTWYFKPLSIDWFYTRVFLQFALDNPELLTQLRILEPVGIRSHNAKLADASSQPGTFYANLGDVSQTPKYGMRTMAYHEAVPGHHLHIAIAREIKGLPIFRSVVPFTAYAEGWALYAEQLAWEAGYEKNPLDNLGRLQAELFRSVRLVVDTGMHSKRWTREQAIDYMMTNTGMPEAAVVTEIERYLVNPGQALAYKVGMLKILELGERAKSALGSKFDLREFHDEVLQNGAMPLAVLERVIDAYVARKKSA